MTKNETEIQKVKGLVEKNESDIKSKKRFDEVMERLLINLLFLLNYKHIGVSLRFATLSGTETFIHKVLVKYLIYFGVNENIIIITDLALQFTILLLALNTLAELFEETSEKLIKVIQVIIKLITEQNKKE